MREARRKTSLALSNGAKQILDELSRQLRVTKTVVIELALQDYYARKVEPPNQTFDPQTQRALEELEEAVFIERVTRIIERHLGQPVA